MFVYFTFYIHQSTVFVREKKASERKLIGEKFLIRFSFWHRTLNITFRLALQSPASSFFPPAQSIKFSGFAVFSRRSEFAPRTVEVWYTNIIDYAFNPTRKMIFLSPSSLRVPKGNCRGIFLFRTFRTFFPCRHRLSSTSSHQILIARFDETHAVGFPSTSRQTHPNR